MKTGSGTHFSVFTPFWRACLALPAPRAPLPEPREIAVLGPRIASDRLADWDLLPRDPDWAGGLRETWEPGEPAARRRLREFLRDDLDDYDRARDEPAAGATSLMSPRLRWGEVSPHTVWHEAVDAGGGGRFLSELGWREFAWHTLFHAPDLATKNLRPEFDAFPWPRLKPTQLKSWQQGRTGVAAGRRRHARALAHRLHAQSGADGRGILPHQEPAHRLAARRAVVLGHAGGCGCRQQPVQLAMGRGVGGRRRSLLPDLQSRAAGEEVRRAR